MVASDCPRINKMEVPNKTSAKELVLHPQGSLRAPARVLYVEPMTSGSSPGDESAGLVEYWYVICHRLPLIAMMIIFGALMGVLLSFWQTPIYQARASLEI